MLQRLQQPWVASVAIFVVFVCIWGWFTAAPSTNVSGADAEYARLAGQSASGQQVGAIPTPWAVALRGWELIVHALDRDNPNNLGIA
jgi:nitrate/nitrite transport system permease protein